jgi:acyl transferase domain-containing protein/aryl carrier-like protein
VNATEEKLLDYLKWVTKDLHSTRQRVRDLEARLHEPVAVIGMACRYPAGITNPDQLWQRLTDEQHTITTFPTDRGWNPNLYHPDPNHPTTTYTQHGGFLTHPAHFDPHPFTISPREAHTIDPQHRQLLETTYETIENAHIPPHTLHNTNTATYTGIMYNDYATRLAHNTPTHHEGYLGSGSAPSIASGRINYTLNLHGPAITIDTACSSSLTTIHLATQALRTHTTDLALAGGATIMATPMVFVEFSRQRALSPDGQCKAFAAAADGAGWSEGVGMVLLERLSDAIRNKRRILAVIRGTAINQDGATNGLTAPNGLAQEELIRQALADAQLTAADIDVVEAHGTGTTLGDPIEAQAIIQTYGQDRDRPLWLGSVKSNLGHTQAAAGVAGLIKMIQAIRHGLLPKTLHVDQPTPHVDWTQGNVQLLTAATPWPAANRPRRAAISAFGMSGTNAHVIIEEPPPAQPRELPPVPGPTTCVISAKTHAALRNQAARLRTHLNDHPEQDTTDIAYSLATTRTHHPHRAAITITTREELAHALDSLMCGQPAPDLVEATADHRPGKLAFLFSGQGSQRPGMGKQLADEFGVFADTLTEICDQFAGRLDKPLRDVMFAGDDGLLDQTTYTQAALFTFEVASFRLLDSGGLRPNFLLGHSIGEVTAAYVAGVLSLSDACELVAARGRLMQSTDAPGAMVSVRAPEEDVLAVLDGNPEVCVAAVNGPTSTVLSGDREAVLRLASQWTALGRKTKRLKVSHAFHSHHMDSVLAEFGEVVRALTFHPPRIPVVSNVTGRLAGADELASPDYWVQHIRRPVRFLDGMRTLEALGTGTYLEVGPSPVLAGLAPDCLTEPHHTVIPLLRPGRPEPQAVLGAVAELHVTGMSPDWEAMFEPRHAQRVDLPTYGFDHQRYFIDAPVDSADSPTDADFWDAVRGGDLATLSDTLGITDDQRAALDAVLPALAAWRRQRTWRHHIIWKTSSEKASANLAGTWLAVSPRGSLPAADLLADLGANVVHAEIATARSALAEAGEVHGVLSRLPLGGTVELGNVLDDLGMPARVWALTSGAVTTGSHDPAVDPGEAQIWGLVRTMSLEQPWRWGGLVDLPSTVDGETARRLAGVLTGDEDQVAIRDTGVFVRRLVPAPTDSSGAWQPRGTVLITGGDTPLTWQAADWLTRHGASRVVLEADWIPGSGEPITAVVHTAAVPDDYLLGPVESERVQRETAAIVSAASRADSLAREHDVSAFVVFTSAPATLGAPGLGNLAAGHAHLEAVVQQRLAEGLPALSVAWSAPLAHGLRPIPGKLAMSAMGAATSTILADIDWDELVPPLIAAGRATLLRDVPAVQQLFGEPEPLDTGVLDQLAAASDDERVRIVLDLVCSNATAVLGLSASDELDPATDFLDLGFSSFMALELSNRLRANGVHLSPVAVFDHPTPAALAKYLGSALRADHHEGAEHE